MVKLFFPSEREIYDRPPKCQPFVSSREIKIQEQPQLVCRRTAAPVWDFLFPVVLTSFDAVAHTKFYGRLRQRKLSFRPDFL